MMLSSSSRLWSSFKERSQKGEVSRSLLPSTALLDSYKIFKKVRNDVELPCVNKTLRETAKSLNKLKKKCTYIVWFLRPFSILLIAMLLFISFSMILFSD